MSTSEHKTTWGKAVRLSPGLIGWIQANARQGESPDKTLRRVLGLDGTTGDVLYPSPVHIHFLTQRTIDSISSNDEGFLSCHKCSKSITEKFVYCELFICPHCGAEGFPESPDLPENNIDKDKIQKIISFILCQAGYAPDEIDKKIGDVHLLINKFVILWGNVGSLIKSGKIIIPEYLVDTLVLLANNYFVNKQVARLAIENAHIELLPSKSNTHEEVLRYALRLCKRYVNVHHKAQCKKSKGSYLPWFKNLPVDELCKIELPKPDTALWHDAKIDTEFGNITVGNAILDEVIPCLPPSGNASTNNEKIEMLMNKKVCELGLDEDVLKELNEHNISSLGDCVPLDRSLLSERTNRSLVKILNNMGVVYVDSDTGKINVYWDASILQG